MKAKEIIKLRERLRLTQQQLADMLGVHQTAVSQWERGGTISSMAQKALKRLQQEEAV